jgi:sugar/nucleoside kinase (ribokinase family)
MAIDLVCLGNVTIDDIVLPDGTTRMACFGGDTIYGSLSASFWTDNVRLVTPIGNDFPDDHMDRLNKLDWDLSGMSLRQLPTARNWIVYEYDGRRTWIMRSNPDDFYELSPKPSDIPSEYLRAKAFLILAMDLTSQETLAPYLKSLGAIVCLDPQEDNILDNQDRVFSMLSSVDIFMPSQEEVHRLLGHKDYERAAREFIQYGPKIVGVKMGAQGAIIYDNENDKFLNIPVYKTNVKDTTGAGDSFCGGFMAMFMKSGDLYKSGLAGAVSASFAIEDFGNNRLFNVNRDEAKRRFEELISLKY